MKSKGKRKPPSILALPFCTLFSYQKYTPSHPFFAFFTKDYEYAFWNMQKAPLFSICPLLGFLQPICENCPKTKNRKLLTFSPVNL